MTAEELVNDHLHLAETTVYRLFPNADAFAKKYGLEKEDLFQYAREAMWKAALQYDESKGRAFSNFAITRMRWAITDKLRKDCKKFSFRGTNINPKDVMDKLTFISFDDKPSMDNEECITYHELYGDEYNLEGEVIGKVLEDMIPPRTLQFIKMKNKGMTIREIGKQYGISHQAVSIAIKNFGNKLKEVI